MDTARGSVEPKAFPVHSVFTYLMLFVHNVKYMFRCSNESDLLVQFVSEIGFPFFLLK